MRVPPLGSGMAEVSRCLWYGGTWGVGCWAQHTPHTLPQGRLKIELQFQQVFQIHLSNVVDNVPGKAVVKEPTMESCDFPHMKSPQGGGRRVPREQAYPYNGSQISNAHRRPPKGKVYHLQYTHTRWDSSGTHSTGHERILII